MISSAPTRACAARSTPTSSAKPPSTTPPPPSFIAVGKKAAQFLARTRRKLVAEFTYHDTPTFAECQAISKFAQNVFLKGEADAVDVLYTRFVNTLSQQPDLRELLPMGSTDSLVTEARGHARSAAGRGAAH